MKVIELLNKIAKGEEVPKKIKFDDRTYLFLDSKQYYDEEAINDEEAYINKFGDDYTANFPRGYTFKILNEEVEVIEDKKIDKIKNMNTDGKHKNWEFEKLSKEEITLDIQTLKNKINEIIDRLDKQC